MGETILNMIGIEKSFGSVKALDNVDFNLEQGEIHALVGTNGAGKSTLVKILSGAYTKDAGEVRIAGEPVEIATPRDAINCGVAAVQQHPELVPNLTGYENIFLGREHYNPGLLRKVNRRALRARADELSKQFPISIDLDRKVSQLSAVEREVLAILHSLTRKDIRILTLDEPTSTLTEKEQESLFSLMRALKTRGISIIYITHRLEEVFAVADRFTIFRGGRRITTMSSEQAVQSTKSLAEMMLGKALGDVYPAKKEAAALENQPGETVLKVEGLSFGESFKEVSFKACKGEILGIYGLVGSGIDELSKVLFGVLRPSEGTMVFKGEKLVLKDPGKALTRGIFLIPRDRRVEGLILERDVLFNLTLANLKKASGLGWFVKVRKTWQEGARLAGIVTLEPPNLATKAGNFSGGNQQKIVIAKGLYTEADLYIFVEPTTGVDIGARSTVYALIRELSKTSAVIVMSSDCDEVHGLADRVTALYKGKQVLAPTAEVPRDQLLVAGIMGNGERKRCQV